MARIKITRHSDRLNEKLANVLNEYEDGDQQALIDLFEAAAKGLQVDPQTFEALADASMRKSGVRVKLVRRNARPKTGSATLKRNYELQCIADEVEELQREFAAKRGLPPERCLKEAKALIMERRQIGKDKVREALNYRRRALYLMTPRAAP